MYIVEVEVVCMVTMEEHRHYGYGYGGDYVVDMDMEETWRRHGGAYNFGDFVRVSDFSLTMFNFL